MSSRPVANGASCRAIFLCYGYFVDWGSLLNKQGIFRRLHRRLYFQAREAAGRKPYPSVVIVDSQSVRTGKMGGVRGYDGGKHIAKGWTALDGGDALMDSALDHMP
jgi:putative transposase